MRTVPWLVSGCLSAGMRWRGRVRAATAGRRLAAEHGKPVADAGDRGGGGLRGCSVVRRDGVELLF